MSLNEQINRVVERVRAAWGLCTALVGIVVVFALPLWFLPLFAVFSIGTYFGTLYLTGIYLSLRFKPTASDMEPLAVEPLVVDLTSEHKEAGLRLGDVVATGEVFGHYLDQPMYEWVDLVMDKSGAPVRYAYKQVTPVDRAGNLLLPQGDFACIGHLTYFTQPVQGEQELKPLV